MMFVKSYSPIGPALGLRVGKGSYVLAPRRCVWGIWGLVGNLYGGEMGAVSHGISLHWNFLFHLPVLFLPPSISEWLHHAQCHVGAGLPVPANFPPALGVARADPKLAWTLPSPWRAVLG